MHLVILGDEDRTIEQKITYILVDPLSVDFLWDVGKDPFGGVPYIMAPISCIKRLIEEIEKGTKDETVVCQESGPFNYIGAKIGRQVVELNYNKAGNTMVEILSVKSLLKIKRALNTQS